jgi:hypothetical protein
VFGGEKRGLAVELSVPKIQTRIIFSKGKLTVHTIIARWITDDGVLTSFRQVVFAVDLVLASIHGRRSRPDVNVVLAVVVVSGFTYVSSVSPLSKWQAYCTARNHPRNGRTWSKGGDKQSRKR